MGMNVASADFIKFMNWMQLSTCDDVSPMRNLLTHITAVQLLYTNARII